MRKVKPIVSEFIYHENIISNVSKRPLDMIKIGNVGYQFPDKNVHFWLIDKTEWRENHREKIKLTGKLTDLDAELQNETDTNVSDDITDGNKRVAAASARRHHMKKVLIPPSPSPPPALTTTKTTQ